MINLAYTAHPIKVVTEPLVVAQNISPQHHTPHVQDPLVYELEAPPETSSTRR